MTRIRITGGLALLALLTVGAAVAQEGRPVPRGRGDREGGAGPREAFLHRIIQNPELAGQVGLTEEQIKTLKATMFKAREREIKLRAKIELLGLEQAKLMMQDDVDEEAVMELVEEKWALKAELAKIPIRQMLTVKKTVTPEQLEKIRAVVRERMRQRMMRQREGDRPDARWKNREGGFRARDREGGPRPEGRFRRRMQPEGDRGDRPAGPPKDRDRAAPREGDGDPVLEL